MQVSLLNTQLQNQRKKQQNSSPEFGRSSGVIEKASPWLQKLDADPIKAVIVLDILTAIAPNTIIDTVKRNPAQGFETFRRESSGLLINCIMPGVAVVGVAWAMKNQIMGNDFKHIPSHRIWANEDTINEATAAWKNVAKESDKSKRIHSFVEESFNRIKANEESLMLKGTPEEQKAAKESAKKAIELLSEAILNPNKEEEKGFMASVAKPFKAVKKNLFGESAIDVGIPKNKLNEIYEKLSTAYGQSKGVDVKRLTKGGSETFSTSMKNYVRDTYALARTFDDKAITHQNLDKFSGKLKTLLKAKSGVTMFAVGALALGMHYINRKLTERMTGRKGYSGYKNLDGEAPVHEHKGKLTVQKALGSAWFGAMAILSMGKPSASMANFAAPTTTMDQARLLSLTTDVGRVNAACDGNEIKDTMMRDTLIFGHLYVLGDFIQRGVVSRIQKNYQKNHGIDLNLMNHSPEKKNANVLEWLTHQIKGSSVKTVEEIQGTLHKGTSKMKPEDILALRKKIVNGGAIASLAYSMVALGIFAPIMIAKITNKNRERQLAEAKKRAAVHTTATSAATSAVAVAASSQGVAKARKSAFEPIKQSAAKAPRLYSNQQG